MNRITTLLLIVFYCSCQSSEKSLAPLQHISDTKVKGVLEKSFEKMGGLKNWQTLKRLQFQKAFALYDSLGNVERSALQQHDYTFSPEEIIKINWKSDSLSTQIVSKNGTVEKFINQKIDTSANPTSLKNTILSSTFVIAIPFKLLDEGVVLNYDGTTTLEDAQKVEVVKAVYSPSKNANHSTPDTWWYYFDANDFRLVGYMVQHADHFSYVKNLSEANVGGFIFPSERKSWRVDENRNILYLRAAYQYADFEVK